MASGGMCELACRCEQKYTANVYTNDARLYAVPYAFNIYLVSQSTWWVSSLPLTRQQREAPPSWRGSRRSKSSKHGPPSTMSPPAARHMDHNFGRGSSQGKSSRMLFAAVEEEVAQTRAGCVWCASHEEMQDVGLELKFQLPLRRKARNCPQLNLFRL